MKRIVPLTLVFAAFVFAAFALPARAEDPPRKDEPAKTAPKPIERLKEWPKPADRDQVMTDIERVCKARIPEMAEQGKEGLISAGSSGVPFVLERYGRERDDDARERLHEILIATTNAEHTRLLAKEFAHKEARTRTFALWRTAQFPDIEVKAQADAAWARVAKLGEKADAEERYAAGLCCASTGSIVGFPGLWDATITPKEWDQKKRELRAALAGARGKEATAFVLAKLDDKSDRKIKVAVLRMLAGCGDKDCVPRVRPFLDDEDNQIRVAAINALRGIVDGEDPIDNLSSFEAIEMAKKWKERS